ncbi:MAG: ATP-binding cassette domain-containing protein [Bacilli bacterium]|nr:ATP-binding cassette domain-containing protein [Bacilli bacterium]
MLELRNIYKTFNANSPMEVKVLQDLNITIEEGDFITVIGGNGAGKSTMLNVISGAIDADKGVVLLNNFDISRMSENKRAPYFGRVFQDPMRGTASDMSILENLSLAYGRGRARSPFIWFTKPKEKKFFVEQLKTLELGLENRLYDKVGLLSGGQRQALTLLMATIRKMPSERSIKRDYVRFSLGDHAKAQEEVLNAFKEAKLKRKEALKANRSLPLEERLKANEKAKKEYISSIAKYDVTKQILLLDEHTAALDPKTAAKVLEITDRIVKENHLTTIMITHNMKDAIKYGNRLIMMSHGNVAVDVSGEKKEKLEVKTLLDLFTKASKDDFLSDSAILG